MLILTEGGVKEWGKKSFGKKLLQTQNLDFHLF
jgi:hypothetical protein